jgi:hypothetical protein
MNKCIGCLLIIGLVFGAASVVGASDADAAIVILVDNMLSMGIITQIDSTNYYIDITAWDAFDIKTKIGFVNICAVHYLAKGGKSKSIGIYHSQTKQQLASCSDSGVQLF